MTPAGAIGGGDRSAGSDRGRAARPADAVANDFFRERRFIGSGDRRAVSDRVWRVLRARRRLTWWVPKATPRLLVAASLLTEGWALAGVAELFSGDRFAPARPGAQRIQRAAPRRGADAGSSGDAGAGAVRTAGLAVSAHCWHGSAIGWRRKWRR